MWNRKFDLTVLLTCVALLGYLGWHGFHGPRSFSYRDALLLRVNELQANEDLLMAERDALDQKVALMRPESVDPDMLEELARESLNYAKPNELILIRE
jgi:cell division protein FtsB